MDALKWYNQFVLVEVVPRSGEKDTKIPVNTQGQRVNAHDPSSWLSYADAVAHAGNRYKVGFVLTDNDPFFCLDIDHCLRPDGRSWSPLAMEILGMFSGAMAEVSHSGDGLHVWGTYSVMPNHGCKNIALNLELYHDKRFILLGTQQVGNAAADCSAVLPPVISKWFPADTLIPAAEPFEWTTEPVDGWSGPLEDDELIEIALKAKSAASVFGDAVSFRDLWEADEDALSIFTDGERAYDASSADAALAQRLAFWTGKNCERTRRLMMRSSLYRDKYERADYLRRTILRTAARQKQVYNKPSASQVDNSRSPGGWISQTELPAHFEGCVYIETLHKALVPGGEILKPDQFRAKFGGHRYVLDEQKTTDDPWRAFLNCTYWRPPYANGLCFRPEVGPSALVEQEGRMLVNTWQPIRTRKQQGDVSRVLGLLEKQYPNEWDRQVVLSYMAAVLQYPGHKFPWALLKQGVEGNGKSFLLHLLTHAVGERYSYSASAAMLSDNGLKFNSWMQGKIFLSIEDVQFTNRRDILESLKPIITQNRIAFQGKGADEHMGDHCANIIFTSNHKDAIPITESTRRYGIAVSAQQTVDDLLRDGMTSEYFCDLWDWAYGRNDYAKYSPGKEAWNYYLQELRISDELNPAKFLNRAPKLSRTHEVIDASMGRVEQEVLELVGQEAPGFAGGWISSVMLNRFLENKNLASKIPPKKRGEMLQSLGYVPHPALKEGRVGRVVAPENTRPRLYVRAGHLSMNVSTPSTIAEMYEKAQKEATTAAAGFVVQRP